MLFGTSTNGGALVITFEAVVFKETGGADSLGATGGAANPTFSFAVGTVGVGSGFASSFISTFIASFSIFNLDEM